MCLSLFQSKRQNATRFYVPMCSGIDHNGGGAKGTFLRVDRSVKFDFGSAVGAFGNAGLFNILSGQLLGNCAFKIQFTQRGSAPRTGLDRLGITTVITFEVSRSRVKPEIRPTYITGKAMLIMRDAVTGRQRGRGRSKRVGH